MGLKKLLKQAKACRMRLEAGIVNMPPADLRRRVHGAEDIYSFLEVGKRCSLDIKSTLESIGRDLNSFKHVLDFGCGCGRTLIWFLSAYSQASRFYGTDVDREAILWCRANIGSCVFGINSPLPPLSYPSCAFDLSYAVSVFTHLSGEYQFLWLAELERVAERGAILLLTVQGPSIWEKLDPEYVSAIKKNGFVFRKTGFWKDAFPEWYEDAYHTKKYIIEKFGKFFKTRDYIPRGLNDHQDMVVLEKG